MDTNREGDCFWFLVSGFVLGGRTYFNLQLKPQRAEGGAF